MDSNSKKATRRVVRAAIAELSELEKRNISERLCRHICDMEVVQQCSTIALFISLNDEPQTSTLIEELRGSKRIVIPRIEGEEMEFYDITEGVEKGAFGIMEPIATTPISPSDIDVMVVPGVVFTREGARCGRGKGFYDKYLSHNGFRAYTIGVCYPCQIVDNLPTEEHDKVMETVV